MRMRGSLFIGIGLGLIVVIVFAACPVGPFEKAPCDTPAEGPADRTIRIDYLSDCVVTTVIGADINYDFESTLHDVRISWIPSGTSKTDAGQSTSLTVSGTVTGSPQNKSVRVWYGIKSLLFTWKVVSGGEVTPEMDGDLN